ncbi:MAG: ClbS/DfsB family four-helix bundle protein [Peptoniphilus harei]|nr:ClbS/DfsB family four-helix bundle protein [Peptoniphilus harei]
MKEYTNKEELKEEIIKAYKKYIDEFNDIDEEVKDQKFEGVDRSPAENLSYQVGWTSLLLKWEEDEKKGLEVKTPSDKFKWNELEKLYKWFNETYSALSLEELKKILDGNINKILELIDSMTEEELFSPHMRKWADEATKTAVWEVYKFIHVNTVAPFKTFRTKIRKWKKVSKLY